MATTNTDAFLTNDTDYSVVDPAVNSLFSKFDYKNQGAQNDEQLFKAHGVKLSEVKDQASTGKVVYRGPECIDDPLSSSMATYRWKNASDPAVHDYAALFHLGLAQALTQQSTCGVQARKKKTQEQCQSTRWVLK